MGDYCGVVGGVGKAKRKRKIDGMKAKDTRWAWRLRVMRIMLTLLLACAPQGQNPTKAISTARSKRKRR